MKCPKCSYVSFDYNQTCPKCNKDIGAEQKKLNLPSFRPAPPFLLSKLTGEAQAGLHTGDLADTIEIHRELGTAAGDALGMDTEEIMPEGLEDLGVPSGDEASEQSVAVSSSERVEPVVSSEIGEEIQFEEEKKGAEDLLQEPDESPSKSVESSFALSEDSVDEKEILFETDNLSRDEQESVKKALETLSEESPDESLRLDDIDFEEKRPQEKISLDESEMVTLEIDTARQARTGDMEDFDLELDLDEAEEKLQ